MSIWGCFFFSSFFFFFFWVRFLASCFCIRYAGYMSVGFYLVMHNYGYGWLVAWMKECWSMSQLSFFLLYLLVVCVICVQSDARISLL